MNKEHKPNNYLAIFIVVMLLLALLTFVVRVSGAEYDYYIIEELGTDIRTGDDVELGRIIFSKSLINPHTHNLSINFTNTTSNATVGDEICNPTNKTYNIINNSLLLSNDCFWFAQVGEYLVEELNAINTSSHIISVSRPVLPTINLSDTHSIFRLGFSKNNFVIDAPQEVRIEITTPTNLLPSDYKATYSVNGVDYEHEFGIVSFVDWTVRKTPQSTDEISVGSMGELLDFQFTNDGNDYTPVDIEIVGNATPFLGVSNKILVYPDIPIATSLTYAVPKEAEVGAYTAEIIFTDKKNDQRTHNVSFLIKDLEPPTITNFSGNENVEMNRNFTILVGAEDNGDIEYTNLIIRLGNRVVYDEVLSETNDELYHFTTQLDEEEVYEGIVEVVDVSGNVFEKVFDIVVNPLSSLRSRTGVKIPKQRFDYWSKPINLLTSSYPADVEVFLSDFDYDGSFSIRLEDADESYLIEEVNDSVEFKGVYGNLTVSVKTSEVGDFTGLFNFTPAEFHKALRSTSFNGEVIDYDIPEEFEDSCTGEDCSFSCVYENEDDKENSKTVCVYERSGLFGQDDIGSPMTAQDKEALYTGFDAREATLLSRIKVGVLIILSLFISLFFGGVILLYYIKFYDTHRWRLRR